MNSISPPLPSDIAATVERALAEDIGTGDLTAALVPAAAVATATVITREAGILCGAAWFEEVFRQVDARITFQWHAADGSAISAGQTLCVLRGPARALLTAERTALNFLQTLSGTATLTRRYVDAVAGTACRILDTRKTIPGLRLAQKYAIRCGGGVNHRIGLFDAVLVKENHIAAAGSITAAVTAAVAAAAATEAWAEAQGEAKAEAKLASKDAESDGGSSIGQTSQGARGKRPMLEVEVETLEQLREALGCPIDRILLDNFSLDRLRQAVALARTTQAGRSGNRIELEASGNATLATLRDVAETGVDYVSVGNLTKHVTAIDLSMRLSIEQASR